MHRTRLTVPFGEAVGRVPNQGRGTFYSDGLEVSLGVGDYYVEIRGRVASTGEAHRTHCLRVPPNAKTLRLIAAAFEDMAQVMEGKKHD
jgi:hypothetical protein